MADHGSVEYATAAGNDLPAHEDTYNGFVHLAFVVTLHVINLAIGLAIIGTTSHWVWGVLLIFVLGPIVGIHGLATGARVPSMVMIVISLLTLAGAAAG